MTTRTETMLVPAGIPCMVLCVSNSLDRDDVLEPVSETKTKIDHIVYLHNRALGLNGKMVLLPDDWKYTYSVIYERVCKCVDEDTLRQKVVIIVRKEDPEDDLWVMLIDRKRFMAP